MTFYPPYFSLFFLIITAITSLLQSIIVTSLGSSSTIAVTYSTATICGIIGGEPTQKIQCYQNGQTIYVQPNVSFESICGGHNFFCGLRSGGFSIFCWDISSFQPRRIYHSNTVPLTDLTVGDDQVCGREVNSGIAKCWRGKGRVGYGSRSPFPSPGEAFKFTTLTSGSGFTCGILRSNSTVHCWGGNGIEIQRQFRNLTMLTLVAGDAHACGLNKNGDLVCKGSNESGQLDIPFSSRFEFSGLALGSDFSCAIRQRNGLVTCWGGRGTKLAQNSAPLELIVAGLDFICGLATTNLSIICWGPGWSNVLDQGKIIPGPCLHSSCTNCGLYPDSHFLCGGSGNICRSCQIELPFALPLPPSLTSQQHQPFHPSTPVNKLSLALVIVGSAGSFAGICTIIVCLWGFFRTGHQNFLPNNSNITPSSSTKYAEKIQKFSLSELVAATSNFSLENKIGAGSFGIVYKGRLGDGRQVAIKRRETAFKAKKFQEKESAFDSELALLSRLHHKHLVELIGFCDEAEERLLVYEYMSNGSLLDHLHNSNNVEKENSILNSWRMRIKIALDAARGIEYLHNYAIPPIIHRDIKSSNILLDANWTAKLSDFGLSLIGPESDQEFTSTKAVGTVGYIDPEYYVLSVLTAKSDVYGLGVVLLELLTGKRAVFKGEEEGAMGVVEYATPLMAAGELKWVLDRRVGLQEIHETVAVELMAYTAMQCVRLEGKERPDIIDIVGNLERAMAMCEETPATASLSTSSFSLPSD